MHCSKDFSEPFNEFELQIKFIRAPTGFEPIMGIDFLGRFFFAACSKCVVQHYFSYFCEIIGIVKFDK